jgi:hypothetical protein
MAYPIVVVDLAGPDDAALGSFIRRSLAGK